MKVLVTGGTGAVGAGVIRAMVLRGHRVTAIVRDRQGAQAVEAMGADVVLGDLSHRRTRSHARHTDVIIHCAQWRPRDHQPVGKDWTRRMGNADHAWVQGLLEAGEGHAHRFIYTSGVMIYGDRKNTLVTETSDLRPFRLVKYKVAGERLALENARKRGFASAIVLRSAQVYGLCGPFLHYVLAPMLRGEPGWYVGTGNQFTTLVHVDDLAQAYVRAAESNLTFDTFNIGDTEPVRVRTYLSALAKLLKAPSPVKVAAQGALAEALSGGARMSSAKARRILGFQPKYPTYREGFRALARSARALRTA